MVTWQTPTGRFVTRRGPTPHNLPLRTAALSAFLAQMRRATAEGVELDEREAECWRMFGVTFFEVMDERVVRC